MKKLKFFRKYAALFIIFFLFPCAAYPHTYKISVIVDTDAALDDIRAIAMLINSDVADIPLIVTSDGAASPAAGAGNLSRLLDYFKIKDTKIAAGRVLEKAAPQWRGLSENIPLPEESEASDLKFAVVNSAYQIAKCLKAKNSIFPCCRIFI